MTKQNSEYNYLHKLSCKGKDLRIKPSNWVKETTTLQTLIDNYKPLLKITIKRTKNAYETKYKKKNSLEKFQKRKLRLKI